MKDYQVGDALKFKFHADAPEIVAKVIPWSALTSSESQKPDILAVEIQENCVSNGFHYYKGDKGSVLKKWVVEI